MSASNRIGCLMRERGHSRAAAAVMGERWGSRVQRRTGVRQRRRRDRAGGIGRWRDKQLVGLALRCLKTDEFARHGFELQGRTHGSVYLGAAQWQVISGGF